MSDEEQLQTFVTNLGELPTNMRIFSLSLRSLYSENAMGSSSDTEKKLRKLRDDTRRDAIIYVKGVLPLSIEVVRSVQSYFENYSELEFEEWAEDLSDVLEEVQRYKQYCTEVVRMHEEIMTPLKAREDEAKVEVSKLQDLCEGFERRQKELEESAGNKRSWAIGLAQIPYVNVIAVPLLGMSAACDMVEAVAEKQQGKINAAIIKIVSETLIPALSAFIDGLNAAAEFFSVIENEIANFQKRGEQAIEGKKKTLQNNEKKAQEVKASCKNFYAVVPGVRTDLHAIPEHPDDQNYVEKWLAEQKNEIEKKYGEAIKDGLCKMISFCSTKDAEKSVTASENKM